jgi:hypothetical protein
LTNAWGMQKLKSETIQTYLKASRQ